jgi:hypothetical protein
MAFIENSEVLLQMVEQISREVDLAMEAIAIQGREAIQAITPAPPTPSGQRYQRTGHLRRSWRSRHSATRVVIRNTAYYADFVDQGTKKMPARPMVDPIRDLIEPEFVRAISTSTPFNLSAPRYLDPVDQQRKAYQSRYSTYGSHKSFRG